MQTTIKKGDLVHVPENVLLLAPQSITSKLGGGCIYTPGPQVGMVIGAPSFYDVGVYSASFSKKYYKIFCMGKVYNVDRRNVFLLKKEQ